MQLLLAAFGAFIHAENMGFLFLQIKSTDICCISGQVFLSRRKDKPRSERADLLLCFLLETRIAKNAFKFFLTSLPFSEERKDNML